MLVQAITLYFQKKNCMLKNKLFDVIFQTCGHLNQNENYMKKLHVYRYIRTKEAKNYSKLMMFNLGSHILGPYHIYR